MTGPAARADTICALATSAGAGSIAVIRVSGPVALGALDRIVPNGRPSRQPSNTVKLNWVLAGRGRPVDQVMVAVFRAPRSYTGEDMVEISCHGGPVAADAVLGLLLKSGCRLARPGEFTRRAVLNGKLTLVQAEAVAEMVAAATPAAYRGALARYQGRLSRFVREVRAELTEILAEVEHSLGFDERDAAAPMPARRIRNAAALLKRTLATAERDRFLVDGAAVAIVGRPNVGKSSLFNRLLEQDRAITSPVPGTTRDRVDATMSVKGVPVRLADTAGLTSRAGARISRLAIAQTRTAIEHADIVLAVFDLSAPAQAGDRATLEAAAGKLVISVANKADRPRRLSESFLATCPGAVVRISCRTGRGIGRLRSALGRRLAPASEAPLLANRRHVAALAACRAALERSLAAPTLETAALEIRGAADMLDEVDAPTTSNDILERIFSRFCVGK